MVPELSEMMPRLRPLDPLAGSSGVRSSHTRRDSAYPLSARVVPGRAQPVVVDKDAGLCRPRWDRRLYFDRLALAQGGEPFRLMACSKGMTAKPYP